MDIIIKASDIDITALGSAFYSGKYHHIIHDITEDSYKDADSLDLDEHSLATLRSDIYGKNGLAVDGNARLIARARTTTPGKFRFSSPASLDLTFERLSDRASLSADLTEWLPTIQTKRLRLLTTRH